VSLSEHRGGSRLDCSAPLEDGPNLVALAVNAWADAEPAWWLNLDPVRP
jgi:hypothetical protein